MNKAAIPIIAVLLIAIVSGVLWKAFNQEEIAFSYNLSVTSGSQYVIDYPDTLHHITVKNNNVNVKYSYWKTDPCTFLTYSVVKEEATIKVIPEHIPNDPEVVCASVLVMDIIDLNMTLPSGEYVFEFYSTWTSQGLEFSQNITIE